MTNHKLKHTSGKWFSVDYAGMWMIQNEESYEGANLLDANDISFISTEDADFKLVAEANAKLMAAAPELLERLNDCIEALKYAAFNYDGRKLESLPDGIIESTGVSDTCLIAVRDALVIIKRATE